ncbi:hypothetical protein LSAT2_024725 [Lamellibrachia satsuma]|nr:hypothetical protein LSAT2_024725 [Lamellibrachia satsuma]
MAKDKSALSVTMMVLLPSYSGNSSHIGNDSIDVVLRGCFGCFDTIACARNGVISGLVIITAVLCFVRAFHLHLTRHPVLHQYIIFYCATLECILCAVHWLLGHHAQFDFVMQYLKLVQFLLVSHLYWTMATRVLRKEALTHRLLLLLFLVSLIYFTVVASLGIIHIQPSWIECLQPYWLALSSVEFLLVQLFMVSGVYITRRLNEISTLDSLRRAQKRDLWILIFEHFAQ